MAITRASNLAAVGSGLGDNPAQPINIGAAVTISGSAGVITATTFSGNATGLGGEPSIVVDSVRASDESTFLGGLKVTGVTTSSQGFSGNITGTAATFSGNVSIADKIIHTGDTDTAIRFPSDNQFSVETAGTQRILVGTDGKLVHSSSAPEVIDFGTSNGSGSYHRYDLGASGANIGYIGAGNQIISGANAADFGVRGQANLVFSSGGDTERLRIDSSGRVLLGTTTPGPTAGEQLTIADSANAGITIRSGTTGAGSILFEDDTADRGEIQYSHNGDFLRIKTAGTERFRITSTGGFHFTNGELIERAKVTAGKLSDNTNIDLENGMVHLFTTQETTTSTPNIRINASTSLNSVMATGEVISVTLLTTAAAGAYSAQLTIDGSAVTENWTGGSAPDAGGSSGVDIHAYTIIKTADATFTVLATQTTTS